jgi:hypothetical protein
MEAVDDSLLSRATDLWETPGGRWYVRAYTDALQAALEQAGEAVVEQLGGRSE